LYIKRSAFWLLAAASQAHRAGYAGWLRHKCLVYVLLAIALDKQFPILIPIIAPISFKKEYIKFRLFFILFNYQKDMSIKSEAISLPIGTLF